VLLCVFSHRWESINNRLPARRLAALWADCKNLPDHEALIRHVRATLQNQFAESTQKKLLCRAGLLQPQKAAHKLRIKYWERRWLRKLFQNLTHVLHFENMDRQVMHACLDLNVWMDEVALL
jgi:hypothetical protein